MIKEKVNEIILEVLEQEQLDNNSENNSNWDSVGHLEIFMAIEDEFDIRFETAEVASAKTVEQIIKLVEEKLNA